jgi:AcrR family transcriptional regulator
MARNRKLSEAGSRRREQIINGAESLIETNGFDDLKMESIADTVGVAKSTLYHYFPQKEDLLFALHELTLTGQITNLREIMQTDVSPKEHLRLAIVDQLRLIAEHPGRVRALMDSKRDKERPYRAEMAKLEREYLGELSQIIKRGIRSGEFRAANISIAAETIVGMTQHARYWMKTSRPGGFKAVADEMWSIIVDGLAAFDPASDAPSTAVIRN